MSWALARVRDRAIRWPRLRPGYGRILITVIEQHGQGISLHGQPRRVRKGARTTAVLAERLRGTRAAGPPCRIRHIGHVLSLERGLRRIVLLVSLVIGAASFVAVGLEASTVAHYHVAKRAHDRREASFQAWLAEHPISDAQLKTARRQFSPLEKFADQYVPVDVLARQKVEETLRWEHAQRNGLEDAVNSVYPRRMWWDWPLSWVVLLGCGAAIGLTGLKGYSRWAELMWQGVEPHLPR